MFIDDISHYATRKHNQETWLASEDEYSKNIQQDRKLIKEGWFVIRFSNWEIKQKELIDKAMIDLQEIIVFS
ncbi:hypothetical protein FACHB389_34515 [Nostoc calcicola FACHB-389]|nr:hypothetical protein FACHB389_34515 [Nostoc calcicola FACHB-389]